MESPPVTRAECNIHMDVINEKLDAGFNGVHVRLDKINGKVERHESTISRLKDIIMTGPKRPITVWDFILVSGSLALGFEFLTRVLGYHK